MQVIDGTSLQCSTLRPWTGPSFCVIASDKRHIESLTHDKKKLPTIFGSLGSEFWHLPLRIWWQFRVKLDTYLDVAETEVQSFQKSLEDLARYNECKSVFSNLMSTYTRSNLMASNMKSCYILLHGDTMRQYEIHGA